MKKMRAGEWEGVAKFLLTHVVDFVDLELWKQMRK